MSPTIPAAGSSIHMDVTQQASSSITSASDPRGSQVVETPEEASLRREVTQLRDHLVHIEVEAESYVKEVKVDAYGKAKTMLVDQTTNFERATAKYEEYARGVCQKEVAQSKTGIYSEVVSAIQHKDGMLNNVVCLFPLADSSWISWKAGIPSPD